MTAQPTPPGYDELRSRIPVLAQIAYLNAGTFGQVQNQANDPRQMQVGLKVYW